MADGIYRNENGASASIKEEMVVVSLDDAEIEYFSSGEGPVIVLLPGGSLSVGYLEGLANELAAAGYHVVRINPRGAGKSTGSSAGVSYRMLAADHPELVSSVVRLAAGGWVPPTPEAERDLQVIFSPAASEPEVLAATPTMLGKPANARVAWEKIKARDSRTTSTICSSHTLKRVVGATRHLSLPRRPGSEGSYRVAREWTSAQGGARRPRDLGGSLRSRAYGASRVSSRASVRHDLVLARWPCPMMRSPPLKRRDTGQLLPRSCRFARLMPCDWFSSGQTGHEQGRRRRSEVG
jgi:hypothetical protein